MKKTKEFCCGFQKGFKDFGENIAIILNSLLLSIIYLIGVGLTSFFAKLAGKNFLDLKVSKKRKSYWKIPNLKKESLKTYYRQF